MRIWIRHAAEHNPTRKLKLYVSSCEFNRVPDTFANLSASDLEPDFAGPLTLAFGTSGPEGARRPHCNRGLRLTVRA